MQVAGFRVAGFRVAGLQGCRVAGGRKNLSPATCPLHPFQYGLFIFEKYLIVKLAVTATVSLCV